ncbi:MAG: hypothetical protein ACFB21_10240 [Opitutales bacterium]
MLGSLNVILGTSHLLSGLLIIGLCLPLALGKVAPNALYGFRFGSLTAPPERWYAINRFGAQRMIFWSGLLAASGLTAILYAALAGPGARLLCWCLPWLPLVLLLPAAQAYLYARRLAGESIQES